MLEKVSTKNQHAAGLTRNEILRIGYNSLKVFTGTATRCWTQKLDCRNDLHLVQIAVVCIFLYQFLKVFMGTTTV